MEKKDNSHKKEPFTLTKHQQSVFERFKKFVSDDSEQIFILKGYAGTGKTTLIRFFINHLKTNKHLYTLAASTGRAAKIVTNATKTSASTVHSVIYNFSDFNQDLEEVVKKEESTGIDSTGQLLLNFTLNTPNDDEPERYYIIDESSMISDIEDKSAYQAQFGSGKLLTDLLTFNKKGKFIFVGDEAQLPPITQDISPALSANYIQNRFKLKVVESSMTNIVRQQEDNSIINASTKLRQMYENPPNVRWAKLPLGGHKDIQLHRDQYHMISHYLNLIKNKKYEKATFIAPSNYKCNNINKLIRTALGMQETLQVGDLLLVTQNNAISGLMNGDMVVIEQIKDERYQRANLSFRMVEVRELVTGRRFTQLLIENIVYSNKTNLDDIQQKSLFIDFYKRMRDVGIKQKDPIFRDKLHNDHYLNALRAIFGYAITCHRAQGGEWPEVFVDIPRNITLEAKPAAYQWIYTAVTRAREKLHIVNDFFIN